VGFIPVSPPVDATPVSPPAPPPPHAATPRNTANPCPMHIRRNYHVTGRIARPHRSRSRADTRKFMQLHPLAFEPTPAAASPSPEPDRPRRRQHEHRVERLPQHVLAPPAAEAPASQRPDPFGATNAARELRRREPTRRRR